MKGCIRTSGRRAGCLCYEAGFTLAELIVATTMISIVMAGVYTAMHTAIGAWRFGETNYEVYDDARYALGLLTRELQAIPNGTQAWFIGSDDELEFFTLSSPMNVEEGLGPRVMLVTYRLRNQLGETGRRLMREERIVTSGLPNVPDCESSEQPGRLILEREHDFELAADVADFNIRYYWRPPAPPRNPSEPPEWLELIEQDQNKKCWGMPQGVAIELVLEDPSASPNSAGKTFTSYVAYRGRTSPLPVELMNAGRGSR